MNFTIGPHAKTICVYANIQSLKISGYKIADKEYSK